MKKGIEVSIYGNFTGSLIENDLFQESYEEFCTVVKHYLFEFKKYNYDCDSIIIRPFDINDECIRVSHSL